MDFDGQWNNKLNVFTVIINLWKEGMMKRFQIYHR